MALSSKFAGSRRSGDTLGKVPVSSRRQYTPSGRGSSGPSVSSGSAAAQGCSSHNNISMFMRGARSRGPYGGPSFKSFNNVERSYQSGNTSSISKAQVPSGSGSGSRRASVSKRSAGNENNPLTPNYAKKEKRV